MKLVLLLFILLIIAIPNFSVWLSNGLVTLVPVVEQFMPCVITIVGLYLLIKSVLK